MENSELPIIVPPSFKVIESVLAEMALAKVP